MSESFRSESDSMGPMQVPASAYYGAQTARAVENFPISNLRFPRSFIRALGLIKKHAALTNQELGGLPPQLAQVIVQAAQEVAEGKWDGEFVLDIFQTGSGTSTNMNANEVIANRAIELLGGKRGGKLVHPNDHVNRGQSSNDAIPTAIHIAALEGDRAPPDPGAGRLREALRQKGGGISRRPQNWPHPFARRHAHPAWPGIRRLRKPGRGTGGPVAGRGKQSGRTGAGRHGRRHRHQYAS